MCFILNMRFGSLVGCRGLISIKEVLGFYLVMIEIIDYL